MAMLPSKMLWIPLALGACPLPHAAALQSQTGASADYLKRGDSSRRRLQIRWTTPAVLVREESRPLERQKAIVELRGRDPRPLLIHREAETSRKKRTDRVVRQLDREDIRLLTHWFHCVRLGRKVLDPKHPYHELFKGPKPAQVIVVTWDGKSSRSLRGMEDRRTTISALLAIAKLEYRGDPQAAVQKWRKLLDQWDKLDAQAQEQEARLAKAIEKHGKDSSAAKKWRGRLASQGRQREALAKKEARCQDLKVKHDPKARTHIDFEAEAAAEVKAIRGKIEAARIKRKLEEQKKKGRPDGDG